MRGHVHPATRGEMGVAAGPLPRIVVHKLKIHLKPHTQSLLPVSTHENSDLIVVRLSFSWDHQPPNNDMETYYEILAFF